MGDGVEQRLARGAAYDPAVCAALLRTQLRRYTNGDNASVSVETAQSVAASMLYTMDEGRALLGGEAGAEQCFSVGQWKLRRNKARAKSLLIVAQRTAVPFAPRCYRATLGRGLARFFIKYDVFFSAHETPADIDYPLLCPVDERVTGVRYIEEYIRRLINENEFCAALDSGFVQELAALRGPDSMDNLAGALLPLCLAAQLLGGDVKRPSLSAGDEARLSAALPAEPEALAEVLLGALHALGAQLCVHGRVENYLADSLDALALRIGAAQRENRPVLPVFAAGI